MEEDLFSTSGPRRGGQRRGGGGGDNLFAWTIALLLLVGLAAGAWIASYYVFGHPEEPVNYQILDRLGQINDPERFELTKAPRGEFLGAREAFERFSTLPAFEIERRNAEFVRNYIRNYTSLDGRLPYLVGTYHVWDSFALGGDDTITSGAVVLAQSSDFPGVLVEHVYPTGADGAATLRRMMRTGTSIELKKTLDLAAILHVTKLRDGRLLLTVMPLLYGSYALGDGSPAVSLEPPQRLNLAAGWPVIKAAELEAAEKSHREYLRQHGLTEPKSDAPALAPTVPAVPRMAPTAPAPQGINPDATPIPPQGAAPTPAPTVAPAVPVAPGAVPVPAATPAPILQPAATPTPTPPPTPAPSPAAPAVGPGGVPLKPFLPQGEASQAAASPAAAEPAAPPVSPAARASSWRLYSPGRMPRGRMLGVGEAASLADGGTRGERLYLGGDFVVTASSQGRAVMRTRSPLNLPIPGAGRQARVVVEFPDPGMVPGSGSSVRRDSMRPFQILSVETGADGVINIHAREITSP